MLQNVSCSYLDLMSELVGGTSEWATALAKMLPTHTPEQRNPGSEIPRDGMHHREKLSEHARERAHVHVHAHVHSHAHTQTHTQTLIHTYAHMHTRTSRNGCGIEVISPTDYVLDWLWCFLLIQNINWPQEPVTAGRSLALWMCAGRLIPLTRNS